MIQKYIPYYKRLLALAIPVVLTQAGQMAVQLVDNAMVGRVGTVELAAASFANSVFFVMMMFGMGIVFGITPLLGQAIGAKKDKDASSIMKNGSVLSFIVMVLLFLWAWSIIYIMPFMGQTSDVLKLAIPYYKLLCISIVPFLIFLLLKQIGEGLGNTLIAMVATIISNLINVLFNYVLIFGKLGFPELGLNGAGIATLISRIIMPIILFVGFMWISRYAFYFKGMKGLSISRKEMWIILKTGFPIAIQMVLEVSIFAIGAVMIGWIGEVELAAHQIALGIAGFTFMIANGVAMATTIRVSVQHGLKSEKGLKMASYASVHLVMFYMLCSAIGFFSLRNQLPLLFTTDVEVIKKAATLLVIAGVFQLFDGLQVVLLGILRGISDVKMPMYIAAFSYIIIGIPVSYVCAFMLNFGASGIWFGFVAGLGFTGILLLFRIRYLWKSALFVH